MDIVGSRVLILGGSGLVGMAIARKLLPLQPSNLVISGLTQPEAESAVREISAEAERFEVQLSAEWGDIFVPQSMKDMRRAEILADPLAREELLDDLYAAPAADAVERSALGAMLKAHEPQVVVDCINTATVFAYQNVFASAAGLWKKARAGDTHVEDVEQHLATLYLPQLIRHVQLALEGMRRANTRVYVKVGTAGTGGMGLNIPFTHSEGRPSRNLLAKSSIAGAHTLLLFLMARTPDGPVVKEIKPTAAISWKRIAHGQVTRGGKPIERSDALRAVPIDEAFDPDKTSWRTTGEMLEGVFLDAGENGLFSPAEFETLTSLGMMEFITPEEIAANVVREIRGQPTGKDVVAALDASTSGPTYRAGVMRQFALERMDELEDEHNLESVAYEMLGPPRLSKLLFEAAILSRLADGDLQVAARLDPAQAASDAARLVESDADLRSRILSIGLPILLPDGKSLLRGANVKVAPVSGGDDERAMLIENGWIDLRPSSWQQWTSRVTRMLDAEVGTLGADGGSGRDIEGWQRTGRIRPGALAAWVFRSEDRGERMKR
ncbi:MAG TPA: hypothetical protein VFI91_00820 [Longimicrobiaceae bacterium]|nr:hypothetical protein [Longimicrobiaceae bacterium]